MAARRVVKPLRRLMAGRTTIMITHDLNLAPDADRILVVDRGRIVETGRHEELMARGGAYARLHRSQNNAVMDTGELRLPSFAGAGVGAGAGYGYPAAPAFVESWAPQPYMPTYEPTHGLGVSTALPADRVPGVLRSPLRAHARHPPDGRPLFRDQAE